MANVLTLAGIVLPPARRSHVHTDAHQRAREVVRPTGTIVRDKFPRRKNGRMVDHEGLLILDVRNKILNSFLAPSKYYLNGNLISLEISNPKNSSVIAVTFFTLSTDSVLHWIHELSRIAFLKTMKNQNFPETEDIKLARSRAKLTQAEAAKLIHSTRRTWQDWEAGIAKMHPGLWELFQLKLELENQRDGRHHF